MPAHNEKSSNENSDNGYGEGRINRRNFYEVEFTGLGDYVIYIHRTLLIHIIDYFIGNI